MAVHFTIGVPLNLTLENATDVPAASDAAPRPFMGHERVDGYRVAPEFLHALTHGAQSSLRDQLERASASICLNRASTSGRSLKDPRWGCAAAIDILRVNGHVTLAATRAKHKLTRVVQTLEGLRH